MKAVKKPIVVDAWQLKPYKNIYIPRWVSRSILNKSVYYNEHDKVWFIQSIEGEMIAFNGDYLIKGIYNELYPCKREIFEKTYTILKEDAE